MIKMDNKGQLSAEYLFIILVFLIILAVVTIPLMGKTIDASNDVSKVSDAKIAITSIINAADIVYANGPASKRTLDLYIPQNTNLNMNGKSIAMIVTLSDRTQSVNGTTEKDLKTSVISLSKNWHTFQIQWNIGDNFITVTKTDSN
jgi:uncharacterized protein (UPF0333 family)